MVTKDTFKIGEFGRQSVRAIRNDTHDPKVESLVEESKKIEGNQISNQMISDKMIFISHADEDKAYAKCLCDLLLKIRGVEATSIFCSSNEEVEHVPIGDDIYDYLKDVLKNTQLLTILLISPDNYYHNAACLNEMGAAWVLGHQAVSILLPGMTRDMMEGAITPKQTPIVLDDADNLPYALNILRDIVVTFFDLKTFYGNSWEIPRDVFINSVRSLSDTTVQDDV